MNHPLPLLLLTAAGLYVGWLWFRDRQAARRGSPTRGGLPGATDAPVQATIIALGGALVLLAAEALGEKALGLTAQQSRITWLFGIYSVTAAPVVEEIIFRGYLVFDRAPSSTNRSCLWAGAVIASAAFALLHPFLWRWDETGFAFTLTAKGWFSTAATFATSLWLYAARLMRWNPARSLFPCFVAHSGKNLGVLVIKHAQGFVSSWY